MVVKGQVSDGAIVKAVRFDGDDDDALRNSYLSTDGKLYLTGYFYSSFVNFNPAIGLNLTNSDAGGYGNIGGPVLELDAATLTATKFTVIAAEQEEAYSTGYGLTITADNTVKGLFGFSGQTWTLPCEHYESGGITDIIIASFDRSDFSIQPQPYVP